MWKTELQDCGYHETQGAQVSVVLKCNGMSRFVRSIYKERKGQPFLYLPLTHAMDHHFYMRKV